MRNIINLSICHQFKRGGLIPCGATFQDLAKRKKPLHTFTMKRARVPSTQDSTNVKHSSRPFTRKVFMTCGRRASLRRRACNENQTILKIFEHSKATIGSTNTRIDDVITYPRLFVSIMRCRCANMLAKFRLVNRRCSVSSKQQTMHRTELVIKIQNSSNRSQRPELNNLTVTLW